MPDVLLVEDKESLRRILRMRTMVASDIREHLSAAICSLDPRGEYP